MLGLRTGGCAEYLVVDSRIIAHKPKNLTHIQCAGAPLAGLTALQCLTEAKCRKNCSVLITAGAGGVGTYAIQIAKHYFQASNVATTASTKKLEFVKKLGCDVVYDYQPKYPNDYITHCKQNKVTYDVIMDCTGEASSLVPLVAKGGCLVSILSYPTSAILNEWVAGSVGPGVSIPPIIASAVTGLGSVVNVFTGAWFISNSLSKINAKFRHVITIPTKGNYNTIIYTVILLYILLYYLYYRTNRYNSRIACQ